MDSASAPACNTLPMLLSIPQSLLAAQQSAQPSDESGLQQAAHQPSAAPAQQAGGGAAALPGTQQSVQQPMPHTAPYQSAQPRDASAAQRAAQQDAQHTTQQYVQPSEASQQPQTGARVKASPSAGAATPATTLAFPQLSRLIASPSRSSSRADPFAGNESLDLNTLAKAAVLKRKEQEQQRAEEAARNHVVAKVHQYAARQAAAWAAAQQLAITWLQTSVDAEVADYVEHHVGVVKGILSDTGLLKVGATPMAGTNLISEQAAGTAEPMDIEAKSVPKAQLMQAGHSGPWSAAAGAQIHEQEQVAANATAAAAKAAAISQATAIAHAAAVKASSADASAAQAAATSAAAVAALQATAVDSTAPAAAVASAIDEAARALAEAKAKATATAEAVLQAAMAQEQQKVLKKANKQLFSPLTQGLVDYPSDEDSHTSRTLSDTDGDTAAAQPARGMAAKSNLAPKSKGVGTLSSLLPMYSTELSGTVGSGDIGGSEAGRASPKPMQIGSTRATLQVPSALTGTRRATLLGPLQAPSALTGEQLGEVLDSLRELQSVHMNLGLLQRSGVLAFADSLKQCPEGSVAYMAQGLANQWRRSLAFHLHTVTQPNPDLDFHQHADTLIQQCAQKWGLALPMVQEAEFGLPPHIIASQAKNKKRKRDAGSRASKAAASFLRATGSAPEAQTLHQLSQARQAEGVEARRLKRDLHTLNADPATASPAPNLPPVAANSPRPGTNVTKPAANAAAGATAGVLNQGQPRLHGTADPRQAALDGTHLPDLGATKSVLEQSDMPQTLSQQTAAAVDLSIPPVHGPAAAAMPRDTKEHTAAAQVTASPDIAASDLHSAADNSAMAAQGAQAGAAADGTVVQKSVPSRRSAGGAVDVEAAADVPDDGTAMGPSPAAPGGDTTAARPKRASAASADQAKNRANAQQQAQELTEQQSPKKAGKQVPGKKRKAPAKQKANAKRQKQNNAVASSASPPKAPAAMSPAAAATAEARRAAAAAAAAASAVAQPEGLLPDTASAAAVDDDDDATAAVQNPSVPDDDDEGSVAAEVASDDKQVDQADSTGAPAATSIAARKDPRSTAAAADKGDPKKSPGKIAKAKAGKKPDAKSAKSKATVKQKTRTANSPQKPSEGSAQKASDAAAQKQGSQREAASQQAGAAKPASKPVPKQQKGKQLTAKQQQEQQQAPTTARTPAAARKGKAGTDAGAVIKSAKGKAVERKSGVSDKATDSSSKQAQGKQAMGKAAQGIAKVKQAVGKAQKSAGTDKSADAKPTSKAAQAAASKASKAKTTAKGGKAASAKKVAAGPKGAPKSAVSKAAATKAKAAAAAKAVAEEEDHSDAVSISDEEGQAESSAEEEEASAAADADESAGGSSSQTSDSEDAERLSSEDIRDDFKYADADGVASGSSRDEEDEQADAESSDESGQSDDTEADTPVGQALAHVRGKLKEVEECEFPDLKPLAEAASKGALQRLSKLPGWKRQSACKKLYLAADAALHANLSKHKLEWAGTTQKRAKREAKKLLQDLMDAVEALQ